MLEEIPITPEGFEKIKAELKRLKTVDRPAVITEIAEARALGDLSENAEYHSARDKQGFIEGRIGELEAKLTKLRVIVPEKKGKLPKVVFGSTINLIEYSDEGDETPKKYRIVGDLEADIKQNQISISSPLAKALVNKGVGEMVTVKLPKGEREYEIQEIYIE